MKAFFDLITGKKRKAKWEADITSSGGDQPVAKIEINGQGFSEGGSTFFSFNLLGGDVDLDDLTIKGKRVTVVEKDGKNYIKLD